MKPGLSIFNHAQIPAFDETDILMVGGGSAGCVAAMAAGIDGSYKVSFIESYGFAGGTSTQMLDTCYGFLPLVVRPVKLFVACQMTL
jgi:succinate dehydrogenase/fumarate reductase flavoprotein subunit